MRSRPVSTLGRLNDEYSSDIELLRAQDRSPLASSSNVVSYDLSKVKPVTAEDVEDATPRHYQVDGWRFGASAAAIVAAITMAINLGVGIWASTLTRNAGPQSSGILVEVLHGDCKRTATINTWAHLAINVVSTALLAGSNYCMQCLVAPTRDEIERAHKQIGHWLDIGLPSLRNFDFIAERRRVLWILLAISSLPLHLLVLWVTDAWLNANQTDDRTLWIQNAHRTYKGNPDSFQELSNAQCIQAYSPDLITDRRTVFIRIDEDVNATAPNAVIKARNTTLQRISYGDIQNDWITNNPRCRGNPAAAGLPECNLNMDNVDELVKWRPDNKTATGCLSQQVEGQCGFFANLAIIWIVVACNLVKAVVMLRLVLGSIITHPLMTVGDAIASFILEPDIATAKLGPVGIRQVKKFTLGEHLKTQTQRSQAERGVYEHSLPSGPPQHGPGNSIIWEPADTTHWQPQPKVSRNYTAASKRRWVWTGLYFLTCMVVIVGLLLYALYTRINNLDIEELRLKGNTASEIDMSSNSLSALYALGLGKVSTTTMIEGWSISDMSIQNGVVAAVLVANAPQLGLSFLYFAVNTLLTLITSNREWTRFSVARALKSQPKPLRTSKPIGGQQRTYFLQLPFSFAVPMIVLSALLHWLISQSIFLAVVAEYAPDGELFNAFAISTCGYSPIGMVFVLFVGLAILLCVMLTAVLPVDNGMPVVGSCSAALAANCRVYSAKSVAGQRGVGGGEGVEDGVGEDARFEMVKGPLVWGEIVVEGEVQNGRKVYGFVSANDEGWRDRVRDPVAEVRREAKEVLKPRRFWKW